MSAAPPAALVLDRAALCAWPLPAVEEDADKELRGSLLIVAGSAEIPGAALLAAEAALRAGAGKVCIATAAEVAVALAVAVPEARVIALDRSADGGLARGHETALGEVLARVDAVLVGPGLAGDENSVRLARALLGLCGQLPQWPRVILDAAALDAVQDRAPRGPVLVTPHAGEMAHLTGVAKPAVIAQAQELALDAARRWQAVVALKGAQTVVAAPDGRSWRHERSIPGLAMSGSGDVLAGLIAGLAARGATLEQAAAWGVVLHAQAGERLARRCGAIGFLARELPGEVPAMLEEGWRDTAQTASDTYAAHAAPATPHPTQSAHG